ncbi:hypothetical protein C8Q75DRAFT_732352 [Abortiporus biennis]|nr:hypothetical protein C8Q75DRAFT_732352 [Abortiporus biennis]
MATPPSHTLLPMYPEKSPFEPALPNVFPEKHLASLNPGSDTDLDEADAGSASPKFRKLRFPNPFLLFNPDIENQAPPLPDNIPPPLPELTILDLHFLEKLNPKGRYSVYKVSANIDGVERSQSKTFAMKVFPDLDPDEQSQDSREEEESGLHWSMFRFRKEKEAYAHLIHAGLSERGIVPHCYGWFTLSRSHVEQFSVLPNNREVLDEGDYSSKMQSRLDDRRPPKALIFDYIHNIEPISHLNITDKVVQSTLMNLYEIHRSNVYHGVIAARNIMVLPGERVMWFDFDHANCTTDTSWLAKVTRFDMFRDLAFTWELCESFLNGPRMIYVE